MDTRVDEEVKIIETKPHQFLDVDKPRWLCLAVGKYSDIITVFNAVMACGHCMGAILDPDGKKIPLTIEGLFTYPKRDGSRRIK